jgi:bisphosphoglycerate-dependent phosphoglycerate mutase
MCRGDINVHELILVRHGQSSCNLNEHHYGALQELNKTEMTENFGGALLGIWPHIYDVSPLALDRHDLRNPRFNPRGESLSGEQLHPDDPKQAAKKAAAVANQEIIK